jgi:hypothetical protein
LEHRDRTPEEDALLDLLVTLIEKFEDEHDRRRDLLLDLGFIEAGATRKSGVELCMKHRSTFYPKVVLVFK